MRRLARDYADHRASGPAGLRSAPNAVHVFCTELELLEPPRDVELPADATAVRVLVRLHRVPLGFVTVAPEAFAQCDVMLASAIQEFGDRIRDYFGGAGPVPETGDGLLMAGRRSCERPMPHNHVTVVVATRNRPSHLRECLETLLSLDYGNFDVIVVDNAPDTDDTERVFELMAGTDERFRYIRLDQAGASRARNAGLAAARGPLVAFVDDDVRVDPFWLQALAQAFNEQPAVACVTGLVAAQSIVGAEQLYFDSRVSWATDLEPRVYHPTSDDPLHPWAAGRFGAGANMAFRLDAIRALGGFDENLGPGTKAKGGEDIDLFVRTLRSGGDLMYDPAALVWHVHRSKRADLERQLFGYGVGLTAYLLKQALHRQVALEMARKLPRAARHILAVTRVPTTNGVAPRSARRYRLIELTGMALGPLYYLQSRFAGWARRSVR
jgi:GT2 family glycosyltransferase